MNVTVGKLRPLSRMVNPVWRAFMPISKWSQHDALASELTTTGSQNLPGCLLPCLTGSNNGWKPLPFSSTVALEPFPECFRHDSLLAAGALSLNPSFGGGANELSGQICREAKGHRDRRTRC